MKKNLKPVLIRMAEEHLACRDTGHHWRHLSTTLEPDRTVRREFECAQCPTSRIQLLTRTGIVKRQRYIYPDGYLLVGFGGITRRKAPFRAAMIARMLRKAG